MASRYMPIVLPEMVGRGPELRALKQALTAVQQGSGQCILLTGEAGIGKSRLVAELRRAAGEQFVVLQGHCFELDVSFPYAPWVDAMRAFLAPRGALEIEELFGPLAPEFVKLLPELSLLIPQLLPSPELDREAEKRRLFETLARFSANLAESNPLLVILEDLHWSDELSLELMSFLVRRISGLPILLIGTYRSEELPPGLKHDLFELNRERLVNEIALAPLTRPGTERMIRTLLAPEKPIAANLFDVIASLTEGNPFFVEEVIKTLVEAGEIDDADGKWQHTATGKLRVPRSIQEVVQHRTKQLPAATRQILSFAAVIGQRFDFGLLQEITATDEQELLQVLKELIAAQLVMEESADQFTFRHALTREAVYATVMLRERKAMHQTVGETIERLWGAASNPPLAELAYHFYQAGVWQKALMYSQRAGEKAQLVYASKEALMDFSRAVEAAQKLGISPPLASVRGRAQAHEMLGEFDQARTDYEAALDLARHVEDRQSEWTTLIDLGLLWQSHDLARAGDYVQLGLKLAKILGAPSILAPSLNRVGNWFMNRGQPGEALPYHQEALDLFQQANDRRGAAHTLELLGIVSYNMGDVIQGSTFCEQAILMLRELDDRPGLVNTLTNLSVQARFDTEVLGEVNFSQLTSLSEQALEIARGIYWRQGEIEALIKTAICLSSTGEYARSLEFLQRAQGLAEEIGHRHLLTNVHITYGETFQGLLALTDARQHFELALESAQELGSILFVRIAAARLVTTCILQHDLERAKVILDILLPDEMPKSNEMRMGLRLVWSERAELELAFGHSDRALEIVERLIASTTNLETYGAYAVPRLAQLRARILTALRRAEEAALELEGALETAHRQGARPMVWRLHTDLGEAYLAMGRRDNARLEFSSARSIIEEIANALPDESMRQHFLRQALKAIPAHSSLTSRQAAKKESGGLTERERQVVELITQGKSNREIAKTLVITVRTVEAHITHILDKLSFSSRAQIAAWATAKRLALTAQDTELREDHI